MWLLSEDFVTKLDSLLENGKETVTSSLHTLPETTEEVAEKKSLEYDLSCFIKDYNDPGFATCETHKLSREVVMKLTWKILNR